MQKIILPKELTDLIPSQDVINHPIDGTFAVVPFIKAVLKHLQTTRQNLATGDFIELIRSYFNITDHTFYINNIAHALYCVLTFDTLKAPHNEPDIYHLVYNWLLINKSDILSCDFYRNLNIVMVDYPAPSTANPKKVTVWRNTSKMGNVETRQAVSVRKWIKSTLVGLSDAQVEDLAKKIDIALAPFSINDLDVRHHNSFEFDAWKNAYESRKIESCMSPTSIREVGRNHTYTCYCSGHHGLPDNGLKLTVLYQDDVPVARAITFTKDDKNYYIKNYGDDRLLKWMIANDYTSSDFLEGTILYSNIHMLKPYVDGSNVCRGDHHCSEDGIYYWKLSEHGHYQLDHADAWAEEPIKCDCCGEYFDEDSIGEYESEVDGREYNACEDCYTDNKYYVYCGDSDPEPLFFHDGYSPTANDHIVEYDEGYYLRDVIGKYDLVEIDGEIYHESDLHKCEITGESFTDEGDVFFNAYEVNSEQPVYFPYDCVSRSYWYEHEVECDDGTLALEEDTEIVDGVRLVDV